MPYDHNEKAGNQGDLIKHIALLAVVDSILSERKPKNFCYCDTFAGYANSQLIKGNGWEEGIGLLYDQKSPTKKMRVVDRLSGNHHCELYRDLYLAGCSTFVGRTYPGSSLIVHDQCIHHDVVPKFSLWDVSPAAIASLMTTYSGMDHSIYTRPALHSDEAIKNADFVFIDPPKAPMTQSEGLCWGDMIQFLQPSHKNIMFWLPIDFRKSKGEMIENTAKQRADAIGKGLDAIQVRWKQDENSIKTVGCQLFFRVEESAKVNLEAAIKHICLRLGWQFNVTKASTGAR